MYRSMAFVPHGTPNIAVSIVGQVSHTALGAEPQLDDIVAEAKRANPRGESVPFAGTLTFNALPSKKMLCCGSPIQPTLAATSCPRDNHHLLHRSICPACRGTTGPKRSVCRPIMTSYRHLRSLLEHCYVTMKDPILDLRTGAVLNSIIGRRRHPIWVTDVHVLPRG
jgi:hypothetical protein